MIRETPLSPTSGRAACGWVGCAVCNIQPGLAGEHAAP